MKKRVTRKAARAKKSTRSATIKKRILKKKDAGARVTELEAAYRDYEEEYDDVRDSYERYGAGPAYTEEKRIAHDAR